MGSRVVGARVRGWVGWMQVVGHLESMELVHEQLAHGAQLRPTLQYVAPVQSECAAQPQQLGA